MLTYEEILLMTASVDWTCMDSLKKCPLPIMPILLQLQYKMFVPMPNT